MERPNVEKIEDNETLHTTVQECVCVFVSTCHDPLQSVLLPLWSPWPCQIWADVATTGADWRRSNSVAFFLMSYSFKEVVSLKSIN